MYKVIVSVSIFVFSYLAIITEKIPAAIAAILGAMLMIVFGVMNINEAIASIDFAIVFLLVGMMLMVSVISETGIFEYITIKIAQFAGGYPFSILILLSLITALLSAFLDNVTTILVISPVTILLAKQMGISPKSFIISQAIASNIGGASTLLGDPPNLIIAYNSGFTFNQFLIHLAPIAIINMIIFVVICWFFFRNKLVISRYKRASIMNLDASKAIAKLVAVKRTTTVFFFVILGFLLSGYLDIDPAVTALIGASIIIIITGKEPHRIINSIEWNTILFFCGLFVLVGGIEQAGVLGYIGEKIIYFTGKDLSLTSMVILWVSGFVSSILDNIPYTATLAPILKDAIIPVISKVSLNESLVSNVLWWSLSLGACLGGNGTLFGASANIVAADISDKHGFKIGFWEFTKYGIIFTIFTLVSSSIYIFLRYLI